MGLHKGLRDASWRLLRSWVADRPAPGPQQPALLAKGARVKQVEEDAGVA